MRAGDDPVARVAAAAAAGARAVLLAEPRDRPLPSIPAGRVVAPVLGVTGAAARDVLDEKDGATVDVGDVEAGHRRRWRACPRSRPRRSLCRRSRAAARPRPGDVKPGLVAPGAALTAIPGNGGAVVGGTAIAAARAAVEAAQLVRERPSASPGELRAALIAGAEPDPRLPARGAGAGALRRPPQAAEITARTTPAARADPCPGTAACARVLLANRGATAASLALSLRNDRGTAATLARPRLTIPPGGRREAEIDIARGPGGLATGRLVARAAGGAAVLAHPFAVATTPPEPPPLGRLALEHRRGRTSGVRFSLGAFERGDPLGAGTRVQLTERLSLVLVDAGSGRVVRRLTPPRGARELLPAEYAYTLPAGTLRSLGDGRYAFRAVARSPRGGEPSARRSEPFSR